MNLSRKILLLIIGPFVLVTLLMIFFYAGVHFRDASLFEKELGMKQAKRLQEQFKNQVDFLGSRALDWGLWDDTYRYVQDKNPKFIKDNFSDPAVAFKAISVDFLCLVKKDGEFVFAYSLDEKKDKATEVPPELLNEMQKITLDYFSKPQTKKGIGGLFVSPQKVALFNSHVIIKSDWSGEPRGLAFVGRYVDEALKKNFSELLQENLSFDNFTDPDQRLALEELQESLHDHDSSSLEEGEQMATYASILDYKGKPGLMAKLQQERFMKKAMIRVLWREIFSLFVAALFIISFLVFGIRHFVLERIDYLVDFFKDLQTNPDLNKRMERSWKDEFGSLVEGSNQMMSSIEKKQQQLVQASKMASIGILTSGVAHEINNPLFVSKGHVQILLRKIKKDENLKPYESSLLQADVALTRIENIVRTLQQYSNTKDEAPQKIDLVSMIEDALIVSHTRMGKLTIELTKDLPTVPIFVHGSPTDLQQILVNLLANSLEALDKMPMGQRFLRLSLSVKDDFVTLKITDTGPGIAPELLDRIFEPFYTTKEIGKGTGLGLFTVHSFVQKMGGQVICESQVEKGTVFKVILPVMKS